MTLLYDSQAALSVEVRGRRMVWFALKSTPTREEIEAAVDAAVTWVKGQPSHRVVLHIEDVAPVSCGPPLDVPCLLCLVGKLVEHVDLVRDRVCGACIQARKVDPPAQAALQLFLSVSNLHDTTISLVEGAEAAAECIAALKAK